MSITYAAGTGSVITEFAADETLGSQAQQTGNNTVVLSNTIATSPPGNGQIGTKFTGYVGRLCIINIAGTPQVRMISAEAAGTGTTRILTVSEDWTTNPLSGDTIHVFYDVDDIETGGAGGGVTLNAKTGLYEFTNKLTIGDGALRSGLQINTGVGIESNDGGSTLQNIVKSSGYLYMGYMQAGSSIAGSINTFTNNTVNEPTWQWQSGSKGKIIDSLLWGQRPYALFYECAAGSAAEFTKSKLINLDYASTFFGATLVDCSILGMKAAAELVRLSSTSTVNGLVLVKTGGLATASGDTTTETVTVKGVVWVDNYYRISVNSNKTWKVINPTWLVTTYTDLNWLTGTANYVYDQRSVDAVVQKADGTKLQNANLIVYENTTLADLVLETYTDALGVASGVFTYKLHSTNSSTTTYGGHAVRVDCWLYMPYTAAQVSTSYFNGTVVLIPDAGIVQTVQATALTDGAGITWNKDTNASSIIEFEGGAGSLAVGDTVTGGSSGADGIVTKIVDGDSTAGVVHLKTRDANAFTGTEALGNGAGWTATLVSGSEQRFSIWINGVTKSMQIIYDYLAALTAQTTLSATGELIHEWGKENQGRALYSGASGFYTERSGTLGVFITNYGAGLIQKFTDNAGGTWTPPTSGTLEVTCKNQDGNAVVGARVRIETTGGVLISNGETNGAGLYSDSYVGIDQAVYIVVRLKGYKASRISGNIASGNLTVPLTMINDRTVNLP